jgi:hypothetical protein
MAEYPATLPTFTDPTATSKLNSPSHSDLHAKANAEIVAITTELGTDPAGSFSTVKARIADLETHIIAETATDNALTINNSGTGFGIIITQLGVLAKNTHSLYVYNKAARINSNLVHFYDENASSSYTMVQISNEGTGGSFSITQNNITTTNPGQQINNAGIGESLLINQTGVLHTSHAALLIQSNAIQVGATALFVVSQQNSSSTGPVSQIGNAGNGYCLQITASGASGVGIFIDNYGNGSSIDITNAVNNSGALTGIYFNLANAGAGLEYAFNFSGSEAAAGAVGGTQDKKIRVKVGTTDYFIPCYTT